MAARRRITRIAGPALALTFALALSACSTGTAATTGAASSDSTDVNVVLGWYADPESGGFYAAQDQGYFADAGLNVTITPGGPSSISGTQIVAGGRAQMGISDAASIALAQQQGTEIRLLPSQPCTRPIPSA